MIGWILVALFFGAAQYVAGYRRGRRNGYRDGAAAARMDFFRGVDRDGAPTLRSDGLKVRFEDRSGS